MIGGVQLRGLDLIVTELIIAGPWLQLQGKGFERR